MIGDVFLQWLEAHRDYALLLVPAIAFLEACLGIGLFVSGAILLSVCTLLHTQEVATLPQMLPLAFLGATVADHSGYFAGRWIGPGFHHTRFAEKYRNNIQKTEGLLRRHGEYAIIFGRLIPAVRSIVPLLTGISAMPARKYIAFDLLACGIWVTGLGLLITGLGSLFPG